MPLSPAAAAYDHVLLDLDGCVWLGEQPTPHAVEAVGALRAAGKGLAFVTNDGRHGEEEVVRKLWRLGFRAAREEVVTVGSAVQFLCASSPWRSAFVIGAPALHRNVLDAGLRVLNGTDLARTADVVVAAAHEDFGYAELRSATQALLRGAALVAAGRDPTFPMPDGPWPGTGPVVAALEDASGVHARNVGKPAGDLFRVALDRLGPGRALVVGDRLDADVGGARAAGLDGAVVLTGATTAEQAAAADPPPTHVAATLADLLLA